MPTDDLQQKLQVLPVFQGLEPKLLTSLTQGLVFRRVRDGEHLFRFQDPADNCFIVSYGSIKLWRLSPQKKEMVMCFCVNGDFIGAPIMTNPNPKYPVGAVAMEDSGLIQIPRRVYIDVWQAQPIVAQRVNMQIMVRMMEFHEDKALAASPVPQKIARFLVRTVDAQPSLYGNRVSLKLTRRDIAERVGTTVETVIRVMSKWSKDGWIHAEDQHIDILNRTALETLFSE
jgi:CRP-like cAMP-binding protein